VHPSPEGQAIYLPLSPSSSAFRNLPGAYCAMPRMTFIIIALVASYFVDQAAFDGRYSGQGAAFIDNFARQFNYKIHDFVRHLAK
jgi:hypothetical protein